MMNKKEQAAFDDMKRQLMLAKALRWTEPVLPDIEPPSCSEPGLKLRKGWLYNAYWQNPRVAPACTSAIGHSFGSDDRTTSQQAMRLYSTKLLALRALRADAEQQCARFLAGIDLQIEAEAGA